jgi:hypothetical protein
MSTNVVSPFGTVGTPRRLLVATFDERAGSDGTMTTRRTVATLFVLVVAATVGAFGAAAPASGAATGVSGVTVTPSTVSTGEAATVSLSMTVDGVDTSDGTTGGSVTLSFPDAVDLAEARAANVTVGPNASGESGTVDAEAGTVTVSWNDEGGVSSESLTVRVDVERTVVGRTGDAAVTAAVDADRSGSAEVTTTAGTVTAVASGSDRSVTGTPGTLYLGERDVDLTGLSAVNAAGSAQRFYGVSGDAEGSPARVDDTLAADVTAANGFTTGGYAASASGDTVVSVVRPRVTDVTLSPGATPSSVDVANGSVPRDTTRLTVTAERNFADAENATVIVEDEAGLDVTAQLTDSPTFTTADGSVTLDVSTLDAGTYNVTVEGADDLDDVSRTVSVRIRDAEKVVSLSRTRVVRGESSIVSVAGAPGDVRYVRVSADDLREGSVVNSPTARAVFDDTEAVQTVGADADAGVVYAVVSLDDDGLADVRLQTTRLEEGAVDVELAASVDGPAEDDTRLAVMERTLSVDEIRTTAVGESVTVSGTAAESDRVKLYAAVDGSYVPLYAEDGLAETDVEGDGTWEVDVDTARVVDLPETYRVVAVADPGASRLGSTTTLDSETLRTLDVRGSASLTTVEGALSLSSSRTTIAATGKDAFTLSGTAVGQSDELRLYHVGPRGETDLALVDERDGVFEHEIDGVDLRGTHTYLLVGVGRDGEYAHAPETDDPTVGELVSGGETPSAAVAKIRDAYTGAGSDDPVAVVDVRATDETLSVSAPARVDRETVSVSGRSTSEDGTTVFVELRRGDATTSVAEASVTNGTWNATLDLDGVEPGTYRLLAETPSTRASQAVVARTAPSTTRTTTTAASERQTSDGALTTTSDASVNGVTAASQQPTAAAEQSTTDTRFPGFGVGAVASALALVVVWLGRGRATDRGGE